MYNALTLAGSKGCFFIQLNLCLLFWSLILNSTILPSTVLMWLTSNLTFLSNLTLVLYLYVSELFNDIHINGDVYNSLPISQLKHERLKPSEACPFTFSVKLSTPTSCLDTHSFLSLSYIDTSQNKLLFINW